MFAPLKLKSSVDPASAIDRDDIVNVKIALAQEGHYKPPTEFGITDFTDRQMFEGLKSFQKQNGLVVDGIARPGGPTELTIRSRQARRSVDGTLGRPSPRGGVFGLGGGVGEGQANNAADKRNLKRALAWTETLTGDEAARPDKDGWDTLDGDLSWGLWRFQKQHSLKPDGIALPGGPTERKIDQLITPLVQKASLRNAMAADEETDSGNASTGGPATFAGIQQSMGASEPQQAHKETGTSTPQPEPEETKTPRTPLQTPSAEIDEDQGGAIQVVQNTTSPQAHPQAGQGGASTNPSGSSGNPPVLDKHRDRQKAILEGKEAIFEVAPNSDADPSEPWHARSSENEVPEYDEFIVKEAKSAGVDPDLLRAIVYLETTQGWYDEYTGIFKEPKTLRPMNVHVEYWSDLGYSREDLEKPETNIKAGVKILKGIIDRTPGATIEQIATLYNNLAAEKVSDYGARVKQLLEDKEWEK